MTSFKPMLAKDADLAKVRFPQMLQPKLDGIRASVVGGKLVTRTLKAVPNASIREALERPEFEGLDGELIVGDPRADDCYRRTTSFVMSESKTGEPWTYFVFDLHNRGAQPFRQRFADLEDFFGWRLPFVQIVATTVCPNSDALESMEALLIEQGYEGVILRNPDAAYKFGRSGKTGPLLKVKRFIDFEARVVGVYEEQHNANAAVTNALGRTERSSHAAGKIGKGTLGGLILVALNGPAEGIEFRCGTGFNAAQRADLWAAATASSTLADRLYGRSARHSGLNGRVAKIKSFPIGVKDKPRHPVFLGWRDMEVDG